MPVSTPFLHTATLDPKCLLLILSDGDKEHVVSLANATTALYYVLCLSFVRQAAYIATHTADTLQVRHTVMVD